MNFIYLCYKILRVHNPFQNVNPLLKTELLFVGYLNNVDGHTEPKTIRKVMSGFIAKP